MPLYRMIEGFLIYEIKNEDKYPQSPGLSWMECNGTGLEDMLNQHA
jgi:hypothetical protein